MITLKIKYTTEDSSFYDLLEDYQRQQSTLFRTAYNRLKDGCNQKQITEELNNLKGNTLDSWWKQSAFYEAKTVFSSTKDKKVIFGGKKNLLDFLNKRITKEEFKDKRNIKLVSVGESLKTGNRKFRLLDTETLVFQDNKGQTKHILNLRAQTRDRLEQLQHILDQTQNKKEPLTVKVDEDFVYLTFVPKVKEQLLRPIANRIFALDSNPNSIGWSVTEWKDERDFTVIDSGVIELKELNKKSKDKKHFETFEVCKFLVEKAKHYRCSKFVIEDLCIRSKDNKKGRRLNKTINNDWIRQKLFSNIEKRCFIEQISFVAVNPAYTSIIGGTLHSSFPDPISPTFEMARRAIVKYQKGKFYPKIPNVNTLNEQWKQTLEKSFGSWKELSAWLKSSKTRYRVSLEEFSSEVFRLKSKRSQVFCRSLYV